METNNQTSRPILTKIEIDRIKKINEALKPEEWCKEMYDAFFLGYMLKELEERNK